MKFFSFLSSFFSKFKSKKAAIWGGLGLVVIILIIIQMNGGDGKQTVSITRGEVVEIVAATGKVKPAQNVELGFDKSGRVGAVYANIGDEVKAGQSIASLEAGESGADLSKARAALLEENIKLRELKSTAPASYNDAYKNLDAVVKEAFESADDAVRNKADQFFINTTSATPKFEVSFTDGTFTHYFNVPSEDALNISNDRKKVEEILAAWQKRIPSNVSLSEADLAIKDLNSISSFLDKMAYAINNFSPSEYAYVTTVNNYKSTISSARSEVSGAVSSVVAAKDKLNSAPTLGASGQFENVLMQEAKVKQAEANVSSLEASFGKSVIRAPFSGVVTRQDAKVGAAVVAGTALVSLTSQNQMYVEANISEIHIGKVMVGNSVSITYDAFPGEIFDGKIAYIEPGDVVIDGVVNYKIRVDLGELDPRVKSGLTSNLKIETSKKENVLTVPLYAVVKEDGQNFVNKIVGKEIKKVPVNLGTMGNNGFVEILSGVEEGEAVEF